MKRTKYFLIAGVSLLGVSAFAQMPDLSEYRDLTKEVGEVVLNESFDRGQGDWVFPEGFSIASRMGRNGTDALFYQRTNSEDYPILSRDLDLKPNVSYTVSFYFRTEDASIYTKNNEIRYVGGIEYYKDGQWIAGLSSDANGAHLLNQPWKEVKLKTTPPSDFDRARLIFYFEYNYMGKIYYDNLLIEPEAKIGGEIYELRPANLNFNQQDGKIVLQAKVYGDDAKTPQNLAILLTAGSQQLLLPWSEEGFCGTCQPFPDGRIEAEALLLNLKDKTILVRKNFALFANQAPTVKGASYLGDDKIVRVDGEKFLPIGFFGDNLTDAEIKKLSNAGVNTYMPYTSMFMGKDGSYVSSFDEVKASMDRFAENHIKVLFALNGQNPSQGTFVRKEYDGVQGILEISQAFVQRLNQHEALLGWYLSDENPIHELPYIRSVREMVAQEDPQHFTVTLTFIPDDFPAYASTGDVLAVDNYPIDERKYPAITPIYETMQRATELQIPTWFVPQAFSWGCFKNFTKDQLDQYLQYPFPTEEQLRAMTLAGAISGAKGFLFYNYHSFFKSGEEFVPGSGEENWNHLVPVLSLLQDLTPFLLSDEPAPRFEVRALAQKKVRVGTFKCGDEIRVLITGNGPGRSIAKIHLPDYPNLKSRYGLVKNLGNGDYQFDASDINADVLE